MEAEEMIFVYKKITAKIKYNENENIGDLFEKCSVQLKKNINEIYFIYNGKLINKDLIIKDIIKDTKKDKNRVYIYVHDINKIMNTDLGKNNEIICNYIVGEFEINEKDINEKIQILNSFESWNNVDKIKTETFKY